MLVKFISFSSSNVNWASWEGICAIQFSNEGLVDWFSFIGLNTFIAHLYTSGLNFINYPPTYLLICLIEFRILSIQLKVWNFQGFFWLIVFRVDRVDYQWLFTFTFHQIQLIVQSSLFLWLLKIQFALDSSIIHLWIPSLTFVIKIFFFFIRIYSRSEISISTRKINWSFWCWLVFNVYFFNSYDYWCSGFVPNAGPLSEPMSASSISWADLKIKRKGKSNQSSCAFMIMASHRTINYWLATPVDYALQIHYNETLGIRSKEVPCRHHSRRPSRLPCRSRPSKTYFVCIYMYIY